MTSNDITKLTERGQLVTHLGDDPLLWHWFPRVQDKHWLNVCFLGSNIETTIGDFGEPIYHFYGHDTWGNSNTKIYYVRAVFSIERRFQRYELWWEDQWVEAWGTFIAPFVDAPAGYTRC